jgi:hypothetical protein
MQERRKQQRWPAYLGGRAAFSLHSTADCLIRNISDGGARLAVHGDQLIPDEFELTIPQRNAVYRARARWRAFEDLGVELESPLHAGDAPVPLSLVRRLKKVEDENAGLKRRIAELTE